MKPAGTKTRGEEPVIEDKYEPVTVVPGLGLGLGFTPTCAIKP